jgi:2-haloacid dehalogenase
VLDFTRFRALTFDCYGTLIDWETGILACVRPILAARGIRPGDDEILAEYARLEAAEESGPYKPYRQVLRGVMRGIGEAFGAPLRTPEIDALAASVGEWPAFPDTAAALGALKSRYRIGVLSNVDRDLFGLTRAKLGIEPDVLVTAEDTRSYKPAIGHFWQGMRALALPGARILHVAQSLYHDIGPARSLGMGAVWVRRRSTRTGGGATIPAPEAEPDLEVVDLASLATIALRD